MQKRIRYPNFCQTENGPQRNFSIKGEKSFYRDTPSLAKKISITESLPNREWSPTKFFSKMRQSFCPMENRNNTLRSLIHIFSPYQKLFEAQNGSARNFFGTVRLENFEGKS